MLSRGKAKPAKEKSKRITEEEIIDQELDTPRKLEPEWDIYRLGKREDHLWMAQLETPITITAGADLHRYRMDFNFTLTRLSFYQTDAAEVESLDAVTLRVNILHPNRTPSIIYYEVASVWMGGELTLTGARYSLVSELQFIVSGTATNLLHVNMEFEVHGLA